MHTKAKLKNIIYHYYTYIINQTNFQTCLTINNIFYWKIIPTNNFEIDTHGIPEL